MKSGLGLGLMLLVGVLAMSSASILIRFARTEGVPPIVIAAYRLSTASLVLTLPALQQRAWKDYAKLSIREFSVLLLSGLLLGMHFATWITSLDHTSVMSSVVLVTTTPLWIAIASPRILSERASQFTWAGIAVAIGGGILIGLADLGSSESLTAWGDLLALAGAVFAAGYLLIGRRFRERLRFVSYVWLVYGVAAVMLVVWSVLSGRALVGYSPWAFTLMIALGIIPQLIGHSAANYVIRFLPASLVGVTILGEPVGSTLLAIMFLKEWPRPLQVIGGIIVLAGIAVATAVPARSTAKTAVDTLDA